MEIKKTTITIAEIVSGYTDNEENGVKAYSGKLNVRPPYQREFVYRDKQRDAVIETIRKNYPLNVMYWAENEDGTYELIDGQQRTLSFCKYANGDFSIDNTYFHNLTDDERKEFLSYKLDIYVCKGSDRERLEWFRTINISGERLTDQELLNANYTGPWLTDAKKRFSKNNCAAYAIASRFVNGSPIRQEYLETALRWMDTTPADYMSRHQHDVNANELWLHFQNVINWIAATFSTDTNYRKEMKGLDWGRLYDMYHHNSYDAAYIEKKVNELMANDEVTDKKGVYEFILAGEIEDFAYCLSRRSFTDADKRTAYERQGGICPITGQKLDISEMEADHVVPWWKGGTTTLDNLQMVSKAANRRKGGSMK